MNVTGTVTVRLSPDRPNTVCGVTCTRTYRSPAGPPRSPGAPLPLSRIRWPSPTPAGMRAWIVRVAHRPAAAVADRARVVDDQAAAAAVAARLGRTRSRPGSGWPGRCRRRSGRPAAWCPPWRRCPWQVAHGRSLARRSGTVHAVDRVGEGERDLGLDVGAAPRRWACVPPAAEQPAEEVAEPAAGRAAAARRRRGRPGRSCSRPGRPAPPGPASAKPPPPNSDRASSYSLRLFSSDRTS